MHGAKLIIVLGGARSGKSSFAEKIASTLSEKVMYIATAIAADDEMIRRVALHKKNRPNHWNTVEEPLEIMKVIEKWDGKVDVILIDCLTLWISNVMHACCNENESLSWSEKEIIILDEVKKIADLILKAKSTYIIVSNELGLGIVPDNQLARVFRDVAGYANQILAQHAEEVYLTVAGIPVEIKSIGTILNNDLRG